jgi:two-component system, NtrC family, sensor histidine kinase HydH
LLSKLPFSKISFRWQIMLLGIVAVALLLAVLFATFSALQYTKSAMLRDNEKQLSQTTNSLVREYTNKAELASLSNEPQLLENADTEASKDALAHLSRVVLQNADGVAGGFYASTGDVLAGYSYPTGPTSAEAPNGEELADNDRPAVIEVAREAASMHAPSERVLATGGGLTLIDALPIRVAHHYVGSAWTMQRLPETPGTNRFRAYLTVVALGVAALACVILTLLVVQGLQAGVRKIEEGLESLEGNLASQISIGRDPDEIRQIARAINRLGITLKEKIEREKQIEDRLQHAERLAALGRLIAGVAHEVRNPLATIRLRVQMCQEDSANPDVRESCAIALQEIERLNGMVNRLLSFSRPVQLEAEPTDLGQLVEQRLANFAELARRHNVQFSVNSNHNPKPVQVDQDRIAQVFDNIIQNAIDAMPRSGGALRINVVAEAKTPECSKVCVEFNDTGEGIHSDVLSRIFDPFFTTKSSGTGLGLSICHELVQAHGGEIQVASVPGCGTTVRVVLPVHHARNAVQLV